MNLQNPRARSHFSKYLFFVAILLCSYPAAAQTVVFDPHYSSVDYGELFTVDLLIDPGGLSVKGIDLEVTFDTTIVELQMIEAGTWLTTFPLAWYFFDHTGEPNTPETSLRFAMAFLDSSRNDAGQLAVARFKAKTQGATSLDWLVLDVRGEDNEALSFAHSIDDSIRVEPATAISRDSFGQIKAIFRAP